MSSLTLSPPKPFQEMESIADLFSMEEVGDCLVMPSPPPDVVMAAPAEFGGDDDRKQDEDDVLPLKHGGNGADKTLAALNLSMGLVCTDTPLRTLSMDQHRSISPGDLASCSSSANSANDASDREDDYTFTAVKKEELSVDIKEMKPLTDSNSRDAKQITIKAEGKVSSSKRKRPGRKRLDMPTEEELNNVTDPVIKKRLQNRKASRECRARKADYLGSMEEKVRLMREDYEELETRYNALETKDAELEHKYTQIKGEKSRVEDENIMLKMRLNEFEKQFKSLNLSPLNMKIAAY